MTSYIYEVIISLANHLGKYSKKFLTRFGAQKYITELLYSKKRNWYKFVTNIKSNA